MTSERRTILEMLADGTISVDEAEQLLDAINDSAKGKTIGGGHVNARHVVITVLESGFVRSNIRLPLTLIRAGLRLNKNIATLGGRLEGSREYIQILEALRGVDFDELLADVGAGVISLPYMLAEIDEDSKRTEISLQ